MGYLSSRRRLTTALSAYAVFSGRQFFDQRVGTAPLAINLFSAGGQSQKGKERGATLPPADWKPHNLDRNYARYTFIKFEKTTPSSSCSLPWSSWVHNLCWRFSYCSWPSSPAALRLLLWLILTRAQTTVKEASLFQLFNRALASPPPPAPFLFPAAAISSAPTFTTPPIAPAALQRNPRLIPVASPLEKTIPHQAWPSAAVLARFWHPGFQLFWSCSVWFSKLRPHFHMWNLLLSEVLDFYSFHSLMRYYFFFLPILLWPKELTWHSFRWRSTTFLRTVFLFRRNTLKRMSHSCSLERAKL